MGVPDWGLRMNMKCLCVLVQLYTWRRQPPRDPFSGRWLVGRVLLGAHVLDFLRGARAGLGLEAFGPARRGVAVAQRPLMRHGGDGFAARRAVGQRFLDEPRGGLGLAARGAHVDEALQDEIALLVARARTRPCDGGVEIARGPLRDEAFEHAVR